MSYQEIPESLFADGWIDEPLSLVSSGKEGTVWCCSVAPSARIDRDYVAVKVYRPRATRSFKNDSIYTQGRAYGVTINKGTGQVKPSGAPDRRLERAIRGRSRVGAFASELSWTNHEYMSLTSLHAAGARVPKPYTATSHAIVMDFIGTPDAPAPKLKEVDLAPPEAARVFRVLIDEIALWLSYERIHGDLSPFNILYWEGEPTVIDLPQAVNPFENPMALTLLERDVTNVCRAFPGVPAARDPAHIVHALWRQYVLTPS